MTEFIEVKTAELVGSALEYSVAVALGAYGQETGSSALSDSKHWVIPGFAPMRWDDWTPSVDWSQGGPLIASNQVYLEPPHDVHRAYLDEKSGRISGIWQTYESWHATVSARVRTLPPKIEGFPGLVGRAEGETPLIAACRAIVASHFGETVRVPVELIS